MTNKGQIIPADEGLSRYERSPKQISKTAWYYHTVGSHVDLEMAADCGHVSLKIPIPIIRRIMEHEKGLRRK